MGNRIRLITGWSEVRVLLGPPPEIRRDSPRDAKSRGFFFGLMLEWGAMGNGLVPHKTATSTATDSERALGPTSGVSQQGPMDGDEDATREATDPFALGDFFIFPHGEIFCTIQSLMARGEPVNLL